MCGIVGAVGPRPAVPILLDGLRHLEYRGYDSAGLATVAGATLHVRKVAGRIEDLAQLLTLEPAPGGVGIGHTRWATHGPATQRNAHPHVGGNHVVAVVHNGVVENDRALRRLLHRQGVTCQTDTDTEVIAQLIALAFQCDLQEAVATTLRYLEGSYALAVLSPHQPDRIVAARQDCPLVIGVRGSETFLASDAEALAGHAERIIYLEDRQLAVLSTDGWEVFHADGQPAQVNVHALELAPPVRHRGSFPDAMSREIHEQPQALERVLTTRLDDGAALAPVQDLFPELPGLLPIPRVILTGCGSSYHAALVGEYLLEELAGIPTEVEYASEFRYRHAPLDDHTVVVALSQSGETADTLAALREAKRRGCRTLAMTNVARSALAREADAVALLQAGPEIGVASTKTFLNELALLTLLALAWGAHRPRPRPETARLVAALRALPALVRQAIMDPESIRRVAAKYAHCTNFLYLGRRHLYPVALEGALKLTEVSYVHAQGYPAAELKHGPLALVDAQTPSVVLVPRSPVSTKTLNNLHEIKARGGPAIAVATAADSEVAALADDVLWVPDVPEYLQAVVAMVPLQLLAYHLAILRGCDVDRPRHLAKSVTVE